MLGSEIWKEGGVGRGRGIQTEDKGGSYLMRVIPKSSGAIRNKFPLPGDTKGGRGERWRRRKYDEAGGRLADFNNVTDEVAAGDGGRSWFRAKE